MKPKKINKLIAEACGWTKIKETSDDCGTFGLTGVPPNKSEKTSRRSIPDFYGDLNAMHEAEKTLTEIRLLDYYDLLCWETGSITRSIHATAAQRAEAFTRTINKKKKV